MPTRVLFMQSQSFFGPDSAMNAEIMRLLDRDEFEVHVAVNPTDLGNPAFTAIHQLRTIANLHLRPTDFGPTLQGARGWARLAKFFSAPRAVLTLLELALYILRNRIQIIHCTEKPRDAFYGVLLGKLTGARSVVHHCVIVGDWQSATARWAMHHADAVIGVSDFVARTITDAGVPSSRVFPVANGLELANWKAAQDSSDVRRELGVPEAAPVIGIVARLFKWKGQGHLIEALPAIVQEYPDVRLLVVGDDDQRGDPMGGSYKVKLQASVRELGLQNNVIFTGWRTDIPRIMSTFDVFAMPTWEEPFGMVFVEAMALEKPVVAWANGGPLEIVVDGETGYLVEPHAPQLLSEAILKLLRDPVLRKQFGSAGRERVRQVFSPERMCSGVADVYRHLLRASARRSVAEATA